MKKLILIPFILFLISCSVKNSNLNYSVGKINSDFITISDAIRSNLVLNGDNLVLTDEFYNEGNILINKNIKISSNKQATNKGNIIIEYDNKVELENIIIQKNDLSEYGNLINKGGLVIIKNKVFIEGEVINEGYIQNKNSILNFSMASK